MIEQMTDMAQLMDTFLQLLVANMSNRSVNVSVTLSLKMK
jgi:hypothetical protein